MLFPIASYIKGWQQHTSRVVQRYWYIFCVLALVVAGALAEALRSQWGQGSVIALIVLLGGLGLNMLTSLIHDVTRRRTPPEVARVHYLQGLIQHCQTLPLAVLGGEEGLSHSPTLDDVYIDLLTTSTVPRDAGQQQRRPLDRGGTPDDAQATRPLSVKHVLEHTPQMVLLGSPGSGKSTFVRRVVSDLEAIRKYDLAKK